MDENFETENGNGKWDWLILLGRKAGFVLFALVTLLAGPPACSNYFNVTQQRGYYPPNADSIGIPIFSYYIMWFFMTVIVMTKVVSLLKRYPPEVLTVLWSKKQPYKCLGWTAAMLVVVLFKIFSCVDMIKEKLTFNAVYDAAWVVLAVWIWALIVAELEAKENQSLSPQ